MSFELPTVSQVLDPRGRCDRRGLLAFVVVMTCAQFLGGFALWWSGVALAMPLLIVLKCICLWLALSASIQRLHDLDVSGWWALGGFAYLAIWSFVVMFTSAIVLGVEALKPGSAAFWGVLGVTMLPGVVAAIWLHLAAGDPVPNRYGPCPGESGFSSREQGPVAAVA